MFFKLYNLITHNLFFKNIFSQSEFETYYNHSKNELLNLYNSNSSTTLTYTILQYIIIPFLLLIIITFVVLLILNRYNFQKKIVLKEEINIKINDFLIDIIFSNFKSQEIKEKISIFKEHVPFHKKWCKIDILNKLITIKQNINGINPNQILLIYKYFGFHKYSDQLIRSSSWEKKILGIYHYEILEYKIKTGHIRSYMFVKNKFLKSNALIAVLSLSDKKFDFLIDYEKKISAADEL